jgi:LysR family transcriptional regulator, regulator for genes of the gallate degradation pathway
MSIWTFNLRHLRAAAETERLGSISAAAQSVSLTQPAVTQALARLEAELGLPLFERHPGGMVPTEAARLLAPRIRRALAHIGSPRVTMAELRALIAVSDAASYVGASAATGLAQASLHRAIRDLSVALRRSLVERRGRGLVLTEAGRRTARGFRLARAELEAGLSEIARLKGRESGRVAVGAMPLSRARLLPAAVTALHRQWPVATIEIIEGSHAELVEPLRDGALDLMIGALRDPAPADLCQMPLFEDRPVVVARAGHPLAGKAPTIADLTAFPWTIAAPGAPLRLLWQRMFEAAGLMPPPVPVECGSVMTIRQILMDSDFLTLLALDQIAVELEAGWLVRLCDAPPQLVRTIGITTRADWRPTALQQAMLDLLKEQARRV